MDHEHQLHDRPPSFWSTRYAVGLLVIGGVAGYYLFTEHLAHVVGALPLLLLMACPLMHVFMHHGHGAHGQHRGDGSSTAGPSKSTSTKTGEPS